jgi:UDP-glucuronate 4-epimerase
MWNVMQSSSERPVLVTGSAGFIGFHVAQRLLRDGQSVVSIDNLNDYYSPKLKRDRLEQLAALQRHDVRFEFRQGDISDGAAVADLVRSHRPECVIHLAAQAGVRWSIEHPECYITSNIVGFLSVLEACRHLGVRHLIYASSSSVYGANTKLPFSVDDVVDHPVSLYAATKKSNELMAHAYSHLYRLPTTGLRFFTVYGPWGRPDMAIWKFTEAILAGAPIDLYNHGRVSRDFTYVDDVVEAVVRLIPRVAAPDASWTGDRPNPATSAAPWAIYNIGNHSPVEVNYVVELIERKLGRSAKRRLMEMQPGDVASTYADVRALAAAVDFSPATSIETGVGRFIDWYLDYHGRA